MDKALNQELLFIWIIRGARSDTAGATGVASHVALRQFPKINSKYLQINLDCGQSTGPQSLLDAITQDDLMLQRGEDISSIGCGFSSSTWRL